MHLSRWSTWTSLQDCRLFSWSHPYTVSLSLEPSAFILLLDIAMPYHVPIVMKRCCRRSKTSRRQGHLMSCRFSFLRPWNPPPRKFQGGKWVASGSVVLFPADSGADELAMCNPVDLFVPKLISCMVAWFITFCCGLLVRKCVIDG